MNSHDMYKTKDLMNGDKWYSKDLAEMKKQAERYVDECEGDCILQYRIFNLKTKKYRLLTGQEVIKAKLPR